MAAEENKRLVRHYYAALGRDWLVASEQYIADEDRELKYHISAMQVPFPDYQLTVEDLIAEDDKVAVRTTLRAVHTGSFFGIAPTGKQVLVPGITFYRIAGDKVVEHWMNFDMLSLLQQLEVLPALGYPLR